MSRAAYRIVLQLDRARDDAGFDDPVEVWTDEELFALVEPGDDDASTQRADERGRVLMREIRAAIDAVLMRHGAERRS